MEMDPEEAPPATAPQQNIRSRTEEFKVLRTAFLRQQQWLHPEQLAAPHPPTNAAAAGAGAEGSTSSGAAASAEDALSWVSVVERFTDLENKIGEKLDKLHADQREYLSPKFTGPDEDEEHKIRLEKLTRDVSRLLKELERMVMVGVRLSSEQNGDEVVAAKNVQRHLTSRVNTLMAGFRDGQELFAEQVRKRDEKIKKFARLGSEEVHRRIEQEEKISGYLELGYTQVEISELLALDAQAQETSKEVQEILQSVIELKSMFQDMKDMIVEQGTMLDRIDYNVQEASGKIGKGLDQLKEARVQQKKCVIM